MSDLSFKVTQVPLNQTALDWPRNMANIYAAIDEAAAQGSDLLALEELALTGYEVNDDFQRADNARTLLALDDIAAYAKLRAPNLIVSIGHPWRLQMRDIPAFDGHTADRAKEPLYDRMNLPFNVQSLIVDGTVVAMTAKTNLYNDERGYEKRYFNEWSMQTADRLGGTHGTIDIVLSEKRRIPFGRPIVQISDGKNRLNLTQAICEDKWVATRYDGHPHDDSRYEDDNVVPAAARHLGSKKGLVLIIPNASPPARDKIDKHIHLNKLASDYADLVIDTDGLGSSGSTFAQFGHTMVVRDGKVLSYGPRMSFARMVPTTATVTVGSAPKATAAKAHLRLTHVFNNAGAAPQASLAYEAPAHEWDSPLNPDRHYEEVVRYTAFWLFEYMRKSGSRGIMEALSGGADSAFNSVIVSVMVHMGIQELGAAAFCDELKLKYKNDIVAAEAAGGYEAAAQACLEHMLTGVYMGTDNSSEATRSAAEFLMKGGVDPDTGETVKGIGGKFLTRNVQDLLDFYGVMYAVDGTSSMEAMEKQALIDDIAAYLNASPHTTTAEDRAVMAAELKAKYPAITDLVTAADGVAYENIQARGRQVLIMLFANKEGKMAVANPNLDEARNAYATFGGDLHSGTINLNAHLPKAYQLGIMWYLYEKGLHGVMDPVRALKRVLKNKPTAELQPRDEQGNVVQNDEDAMQRSFDQMNYISDQMLYTRVQTDNGARRLNACEVFNTCADHKLFTNVDENTLYNMVRVSYNRWGIAQHKIHATPVSPTFGRNVDHQTSLRTPNLSGQSRDELTLLGLKLVFKWAKNDGIAFAPMERALLEKRAWQDEKFVSAFALQVESRAEDRNYDLKPLYEKVRERGWDGVFTPLPANDAVRVVTEARYCKS